MAARKSCNLWVGIQEVLRKGAGDSVVWMIAMIVVFVSISHCKATSPLSLVDLDHFYIDRRNVLFGIPNTWNVLSALLHAIAGVYGLRKVIVDSSPTDWENGIWTIGAICSIAQGVANAYYYLQPCDERLIYRFAFGSVQRAALFALVIYSNVGEKLGALVFLPLVLYGGVATGYFEWNRNLRMYFILQTMYTTILPIITRGKNAVLPFPWLCVFGCHFGGLMLIRKDLDFYIRTTGRVSGATVGNALVALGVVSAFALVRRGSENVDEPVQAHDPSEQGKEDETKKNK